MAMRILIEADVTVPMTDEIWIGTQLTGFTKSGGFLDIFWRNATLLIQI